MFKSKMFPGVVMNKYGTVMQNSVRVNIRVRDLVWKEAIEAGWTKEKSSDQDVGLIWVAPQAQDSTDEIKD